MTYQYRVTLQTNTHYTYSHFVPAVALLLLHHNIRWDNVLERRQLRAKKAAGATILGGIKSRYPILVRQETIFCRGKNDKRW